MSNISANYAGVTTCLDDMSKQATLVTNKVEELVQKVGAIAQVFHGQASASYQEAQNLANQRVEEMKTRLSQKINDARLAMEIYQQTDLRNAAQF
jgi:WXG100 family type VII secretion target